MKTTLLMIGVAIAAGLIGGAVGYYWAEQHRGTETEWAALRSDLRSFLVAIPGFEEHAVVLDSALNRIHSDFRNSGTPIPRTERQKQAYRAAMVLAMLDESGQMPEGATNVLWRALKRLGFASWWNEPAIGGQVDGRNASQSRE